MNEKSQVEFVIQQIKKNGFVTINQCVRAFITRLSSIIFKLKKRGYEFKGEFRENKTLFGTDRDFVYVWTNPDVEIKTTFTFFWIDEDNNETPITFEAKSFEEACAMFLNQPPIFLFAINEECEDNFGEVYTFENTKIENQFRTYSKPKKRHT